MTVTAIANPDATLDPVTVVGDRLVIHDLTVSHGEAAAIARMQLEEGGPQALADLVSRALPVGLVSVSMGSAAVDTAAIQRTLDSFADRVDVKSRSALEGLDETLSRLRAGEQLVAKAASDTLSRLPAQIESALRGESGSVRAAVTEATRAAQAAGMQEIRSALTQHAESMRNVLSLDTQGPVAALRRDLLDELTSTRQELAEQLTVVRGMLHAAQAQKVAASKNTRAIGLDWEAEAVEIANEIVTSAGDRFEACGSQPGVGGTTRRTGDGVATLTPAITGHGRSVRIVIEAKKRSKPLTPKQLREEVAAARGVRDAAAGLVLVPTASEVPGGGRFARVDDLAFVVAADDLPTATLVYLVLRELTALVAVRQDDGDELDLTKLEGHLNLALMSLAEFDSVGRLAVQAEKSLVELRTIGSRVQRKIHEALTGGLMVLHK